MRLAPAALLLAALTGCGGVALPAPGPSMLAGEAGAPLLAAAAAPEAPRSPASVPADPDGLMREAWEALSAGDMERAMFAYERVLARSGDARVQLRALICIAMARVLPSSPAHDAEAAALAMEELERRMELYGLEHEFFGQLELLRLVARQDADLSGQRAANARLRRDLAARDALIRELRALSVEQQ